MLITVSVVSIKFAGGKAKAAILGAGGTDFTGKIRDIDMVTPSTNNSTSNSGTAQGQNQAPNTTTNSSQQTPQREIH